MTKTLTLIFGSSEDPILMMMPFEFLNLPLELFPNSVNRFANIFIVMGSSNCSARDNEVHVNVINIPVPVMSRSAPNVHPCQGIFGIKFF